MFIWDLIFISEVVYLLLQVGFIFSLPTAVLLHDTLTSWEVI